MVQVDRVVRLAVVVRGEVVAAVLGFVEDLLVVVGGWVLRLRRR